MGARVVGRGGEEGEEGRRGRRRRGRRRRRSNKHEGAHGYVRQGVDEGVAHVRNSPPCEEPDGMKMTFLDCKKGEKNEQSSRATSTTRKVRQVEESGMGG